MAEPTVPFNFMPRPYQRGGLGVAGDWKADWGLWGALEAGCKRCVAVWHRRAGKDLVALNWTVVASQMRVGVYWHVFPTAKQGRKVIWEGKTNDGRDYLDFWPRGAGGRVPGGIVASENNTEMKLRLTNGSLWQVVGADNWEEALVGGNPVGVVISEWSLMRPSVWEIGLRPILRGNDGWAIFCYTPRGKNHGHTTLELARKHPSWFAQVLTIADTGLVSEADLDEERVAGMAEETIQQEYYCSFEGSVLGSYYADLLARARLDGRIGRVPYDPRFPVITAWDVGTGDATAVWFVQQVGLEVRCIDYYQKSGKGVDHFAGVLRDKGYAYAPQHLGPHDLKQREWGGSGRSRLQQARTLGVRFKLVPKWSIKDGINAVRALLPTCWFDADKCREGLAALKDYSKEWDEENQVFADRPLHDKNSHAADAFRYLAVGLRGPADTTGSAARQTHAITEDNPAGTWARPQVRQLSAILEE